MSAAQTNPAPWYQKLPVLASDEAFAALRRLVEESDYTLEGICRRMNVPKIEKFCAPPPGGRKIENSLDALIALFFDCGFVEEEKVAAVLPPGSLALFDSLGLLAREGAPSGSIYATAALTPAFGLWMACDRAGAPDGTDTPGPPDLVYPAIFETTVKFMEELPETPCDAMLDLGTGTGVAALAGARHARHVWATDLTARSVHFAEFNRRLAGIGNITVLQGDLYAPVEGLSFDRIVIHPPYVPSSIRRPQYVFAMSGDDGEQILRSTVQDLARFLRPGGRFHSLQMASDRENESFEQRIRSWLGAAENEFDLLLAVHGVQTPFEYLAYLKNLGRLTQESTREWLDLWDRTRTKSLVYGAVLLERHDEPRDAITRRVSAGDGYDGRDLVWLLEWEKAIRRPDRVEMLLSSRPLAPFPNDLHEVKRVYYGRFRTHEFRMEIPGPFRNTMKCEEWLTQIISQCNGVTSWREHLERAKNAAIIRSDITPEKFAELLARLVAGGALEIPEFRRNL